MISTSRLKKYRSLKRKKYRRLERKFLLEGVNLCESALESSWQVLHLLVARSAADRPEIERIAHFARERDIPVDLLADREFLPLCETVTPQGVVAVAAVPDNRFSTLTSLDFPLVLLLDRISDPGNLGTILRTAEWFGVKGVICSEGCADPFSGKVLRSSAGALFFLPFFSWDADPKSVAREFLLRGYRLLAADAHRGVPLSRLTREEKTVLVLGSERHGPGSWVEELGAEFVRIPGRGRTESLNVAIAASVLISHFCLDRA